MRTFKNLEEIWKPGKNLKKTIGNLVYTVLLVLFLI